MVLCKFFQQGSCRFGSKCANEHFDVKQVIRTDVESAINGKQWPLSSYGPFKDKPSLPNFIEDQSFEEVRLLCYGAKQKNFFEQFHQQFNKEALEANNKMKALLQLTPEIIEVAVNIYDMPSGTSDSVVAGKVANTTNNPFGITNSSSATSASSIFARPNVNTVISNNSIFGNSGSNAFGSTNQVTSGGIFGNTSTFAAQPQQQQQQTSIFGQAAKSSNSIFGGANNTNAQQNNIFGQQQNHTNVFASSAQPSSGIFSQQNQFAQQQTQQNANIFRQATQTSQPQQGLFAQAAQIIQPQPAQQGLFAQATQPTANGGQSYFAPAPQQTQNMFGQTLQQQQHQQPANSNIFQQNPANSGQHQQPNIFQQNQTITTQQIPNQQPSAGLFQQASIQAESNATKLSQPIINSGVYSRLEDLTAEEIESFKADAFLPGKIPFNPPPRELIH